MKRLAILIMILSISFSIDAKKNKGNGAQERQKKRNKDMKVVSRGEYKHVLGWESLYNRIYKSKKKIKKRM